MPHRLTLLDATLDLLDAAMESEDRLRGLLDADLAEGWVTFPEALPYLREVRARDPEGAWGTLLFVQTKPRVLVGMGGFKGAPSDEGMVEIGYGIAPAHRGQGLATLAAQAMVRRAFEDPRVMVIRAHTLAAPNASTRVLGHVGMVRIAEHVEPEVGPVWLWELRRR